MVNYELGKRPEYWCRLSGIQIAVKCDGKACASCGWNQEVNDRRREELHLYANGKRLHEWGVAGGNDEKESFENTNLDV